MDRAWDAPRVRAADLRGPDAVAVSALVEAYLAQTEREKAKHLGEPFAAELPERYRPEIEHPARAYAGATVYLAELADSPVGVAVLQKSAEAHEIKRLWVDASARGHRVGSALIDAALSEQDRAVRLTVWDWRDDAIRLYRSRGFVDVPSWDDRPRLLCMESRPVI